MLSRKKFFGAFDSQALNIIHKFASAVVTSTRIALSIFVSEDRTTGLKYSTRGVVL
jgi:hypothetical protein